MRYKQFGKTGMQVSEMALGTWGIGGVGWDANPEETRLDAIRAAVESGVTFFDTAPAYNAGAAEKVLGKALRDMGARKDVVISTKCGNEYINGGYVKDGDPAKILRECEESLRNLQTDYIDLYLVHWPDPNTPFEATMDALNRLKKEGKILHVGVSNFSRQLCRRFPALSSDAGQNGQGIAQRVPRHRCHRVGLQLLASGLTCLHQRHCWECFS